MPASWARPCCAALPRRACWCAAAAGAGAPSPAATPTPAPAAAPAATPAPAGAAPASRRERSVPDVLRLPLVEETLDVLESQNFLDRLWTKDASLWRGDPALIGNRL